MQEAKRIAKNTSILYIRMAITVFISLYSTRLILNALGVVDYGIFNLVGGVISMLTFLDNAMAAATQRFMSFAQGEGNSEKQKNIFNVSVVLHFVIGLLVVLLFEGVGYLLLNGLLKIDPSRLFAAKAIYHFMVISTFFTIISVPYDAVINAHENMLLVAIIGVFEALMKLGIAFYIIYSANDKLIFYGLLMASLSILLMVIQRIYCHFKYQEVVINLNKYFDKKLLSEMSGFAGWSFLGSSSSMIANYGQGIVINMFFGTAVNASQGIASQISGQLSAFAGTMLKALNPIIAKSEGSGNRQLMLKASFFGIKIGFVLLIFFYIPMLIELQYIFKLWLRNVPDYAIIFCRLLLIRDLIGQLFSTLPSTIAAVGNIKEFQIYSSLLTFIPIIVSYVLFQFNYLPVTLYIVYIIYSILLLLLTLYFAKTNTNLSISFYLREVVFKSSIVFITSFSLSFIITLVIHQKPMQLILVILVSFFTTLIMTWFIEFSKIEKTNIKNRISEIYYNKRFK